MPGNKSLNTFLFKPEYILLAVFVCFLRFTIIAQQNKLDSLRSALNTLRADTTRVNTLLELSAEYIKQRKNDTSIVIAQKAFDLAKKVNFKRGIAESLYLMAYAEKEQVKALDYLLKAVAVLENEKPGKLIVKIYRYIGQLNSFHNNHELALKNYQQALKYAIQVKDSIGIAGVYAGLALIYHEQKDNEKSKSYYLKSINMSLAMNNTKSAAIALGNLANVYHEEKDFEKMANVLERCVELFRDLQSERGVALRLSTLGRAYLKLGRKKEALACLNEARELAIKTKYDLAISENTNGFTEYYAVTGDYKKAFRFQSEYYKHKDSTNTTEQSLDLTNLQFKYEAIAMEKIKILESETKEIKHQDEIKQRNIVIYASVIGLALVAGFSLFIFRAYRQKQKTNLLLSEKNKIIEEKQKEILDSIRYAKRIQTSLITSEKQIDKDLNRLGR